MTQLYVRITACPVNIQRAIMDSVMQLCMWMTPSKLNLNWLILLIGCRCDCNVMRFHSEK